MTRAPRCSLVRLLLSVLCIPFSLCCLARSQDFDTNLHKTAPAPESAQRSAANAAMDAHDFELALKLLTPLAASSPKDAHLLYDLGSAQDALDQNSPAESSYRAAIADDPALLEPHLALGLLLARAGRFDDARTELAAAAGLTEADKLLRARAYRALARIDQKAHAQDAAADLLAALKLSPETPDDTRLTAELAQSTAGGAPAAEASYRRLLAATPNDPDTAASLARLLVLQKRPAEAEPILTGALAAHAGNPALTAQLATLYQSQGDTAKALPLAEGLHAAMPLDPNVTRLLADLYLETGNDARAEPMLAALLARTPRDAVLADERARALIHLKRFAEAQSLLAPLIAEPALFPTPQDLGNTAGDLAFAASVNGAPELTLRALNVRATVFPTSAPILFLTAISHDKLHHTKLAQEAYKQFLAASNGSNPDEEFEARHRLVALEHMK